MFEETYRKVPCLAALPKTGIEVISCNFKGDTTNDALTTGILAFDSNVRLIKNTIANFKNGGVMIQGQPQNELLISENQIYQCDTAGVYIQGRASKPIIRKNKIAFCKGVAIITNLDVDASVSPFIHLILLLRSNKTKSY